MTKQFATVAFGAFLLMTTALSAPVFAQSSDSDVTFDNALSAFNYGDNQLANRYFWQLAADGDYRAQYYLAYMLDSGLANGRDPATAFSWYRKSAEQDYLPAIVQLGYLYSIGRGTSQSDADAFKWYAKGAQMGDPVAQNNLGTMIRAGKPYRKDDKLAAQWFTLAAKQNNARAQFNLASMYRLGQGVPKNEAEAVRWYGYAARQGDPFAQNALGYMYANGLGVKQDADIALEWYRRAAEQKHLPSQLSLAHLYELRANNTDSPTAEKDAAQAAVWYTHAANAGNERAQTKLGSFYLRGFGVPQSEAEAFRWYKMAADNAKYPPAIVSLARIYEQGKTVRIDKERAFRMYEEAANKGYAPAMLELGRVYQNGIGVGKDLARAYEWYAIAANNLDDADRKADAVVARISLSKSLNQAQLSGATTNIQSWNKKPFKDTGTANDDDTESLSYQ